MIRTSIGSSVNLSYSYYPSRGGCSNPGRSASGTISIGQQTNAGISLNFQVSPSVLFTTSASYNLSTGQMNEADFSVNATCDCLSIGLLYRVFPTNPSGNTLYITLNVNTLGGAAGQFQFGSTPR